jgi:hypothetical protein
MLVIEKQAKCRLFYEKYILKFFSLKQYFIIQIETIIVNYFQYFLDTIQKDD